MATFSGRRISAPQPALLCGFRLLVESMTASKGPDSRFRSFRILGEFGY